MRQQIGDVPFCGANHRLIEIDQAHRIAKVQHLLKVQVTMERGDGAGLIDLLADLASDLLCLRPQLWPDHADIGGDGTGRRDLVFAGQPVQVRRALLMQQGKGLSEPCSAGYILRDGATFDPFAGTVSYTHLTLPTKRIV